MSISNSNAHVMGNNSVVYVKRRMVPGHDQRASAALGEGTHEVGRVAPSASVSELVPGTSTCPNVGGGGRGRGAEPLRGHGAEPRLVYYRITGRDDPQELQLEPEFPQGDVFEIPVPPQPGRGRIPKSVIACMDDKWHVRLVHRKTEEVMRVPFRCHSFRCPRCGGRIARRDYLRTMAAFDKHSSWAYLVLTLDVKSYTNNGKTNQHAYRVINENLKKLRKRMQRKYGPMDYVRVVERTPKNSFPHVNVVFHCSELFNQFSTDEEISNWNKRWLTSNARQCGFGKIHTISFAQDKQSLANYLAKTGLFSTIAKEISKQSQVPFDAPNHFRRLGATRGLLPPIKKENVEWNGELIKGPLPVKSEEEKSHAV